MSQKHSTVYVTVSDRFCQDNAKFNEAQTDVDSQNVFFKRKRHRIEKATGSFDEALK